MISSDCVYATVAWGKKESKSVQVDVMAEWMRSSNGRQKGAVKREKLCPSRRRMVGVLEGRVKSKGASYAFMR